MFVYVCWDLVKTLNPKYTPPSRDYLSNTLIPLWYKVEKSNIMTELSEVSSVALTCDGWSSITLDHYLTITARYIGGLASSFKIS